MQWSLGAFQYRTNKMQCSAIALLSLPCSTLPRQIVSSRRKAPTYCSCQMSFSMTGLNVCLFACHFDSGSSWYSPNLPTFSGHRTKYVNRWSPWQLYGRVVCRWQSCSLLTNRPSSSNPWPDFLSINLLPPVLASSPLYLFYLLYILPPVSASSPLYRAIIFTALQPSSAQEENSLISLNSKLAFWLLLACNYSLLVASGRVWNPVRPTFFMVLVDFGTH